MAEDTNDWEYTQWEGGYSGAGKSAVWSNNNIEGGIFRRKVFKDGYAKRFGPWNRVILNPKEVEIPVVARKGEGAIFICGYIDGGASRTLQYYNGELEYDSATERFSSKWYTDTAWTLSDSIISRRISEKEEDVGETLVDPNWDASVYGGIEWSRADEETGEVVVDKSDWREELKDYYVMPHLIQGCPIVKRFTYQSLTKSHYNQEFSLKRDEKFYSDYFNYLFEPRRYCWNSFSNNYFYKFTFNDCDSSKLALDYYGWDGLYKISEVEGISNAFLDRSNENTKDTAILTIPYGYDNTIKTDVVPQYAETLYTDCLIDKSADITKYEYDWRICYNLLNNFIEEKKRIILNEEEKEIIIKYGYNFHNVDDYSKKNTIAYQSFTTLNCLISYSMPYYIFKDFYLEVKNKDKDTNGEYTVKEKKVIRKRIVNVNDFYDSTGHSYIIAKSQANDVYNFKQDDYFEKRYDSDGNPYTYWRISITAQPCNRVFKNYKITNIKVEYEYNNDVENTYLTRKAYSYNNSIGNPFGKNYYLKYNPNNKLTESPAYIPQRLVCEGLRTIENTTSDKFNIKYIYTYPDKVRDYTPDVVVEKANLDLINGIDIKYEHLPIFLSTKSWEENIKIRPFGYFFNFFYPDISLCDGLHNFDILSNTNTTDYFYKYSFTFAKYYYVSDDPRIRKEYSFGPNLLWAISTGGFLLDFIWNCSEGVVDQHLTAPAVFSPRNDYSEKYSSWGNGYSVVYNAEVEEINIKYPYTYNSYAYEILLEKDLKNGCFLLSAKSNKNSFSKLTDKKLHSYSNEYTPDVKYDFYSNTSAYWSDNFVTYYGCQTKENNQKYFKFTENTFLEPENDITPDYNGRFHKNKAAYINYLVEGVYPANITREYYLLNVWSTDITEGFSGIEVNIDGLITNENDENLKCTTGFNIPCDSVMIRKFSLNNISPITYSNIFSKDYDLGYTTNKGIMPVLKGFWQPPNEEGYNSQIENAIFGIETQCMIEGPDYFFSHSQNEVPPGFEQGYIGYKSRGLLISISRGGTYNNHIIDGETSGFFDYFKEQNTKRYPFEAKRAYDDEPQGLMRNEVGYYWDFEDCFGPYEISSPYAYETQLAGKMSFVVRLGYSTAVLFMFAYDIDKWPTSEEDTPTEYKHPEILPEEEYSFKTAFLTAELDGAEPVIPHAFKDFQMEKALCPLVERSKTYNTDKKLEEAGRKFAKDRETKKEYEGITIPGSPKDKDEKDEDGNLKGDTYNLSSLKPEDYLPQYEYDEEQKILDEQKISRGVVRLVRWRTFTWREPKLDKDGNQVKKNKKSVFIEHRDAIAECAVSYTMDASEYVDLFYTGKDTVLLHFSKNNSSVKEENDKTDETVLYEICDGDTEIKNIRIPKNMCWQEDTSNEAEKLAGTRKVDIHVYNLTKLGIFDILTIKEQSSSEEEEADPDKAPTLKDFEVITLPVTAKDAKTGKETTFYCVSKNGEDWEISGKIGAGFLSHTAAGTKLTEEQKENPVKDETKK